MEGAAEQFYALRGNMFNHSDSDDIFIHRSRFALGFRFRYHRPIQIILRIYKSPAEILMGRILHNFAQNAYLV